MRKENSTFKTKFRSEAGSKLKNTDYFAFVELEDYACYCIADGIDKDRNKESAKSVVEEAIRIFLEKPKFSKNCLKRCMEGAHKFLKEESKDTRLEASFMVVITNYNTIMWGSAGDIRLYHYRNDAIKSHSIDQSLSNTMAEEGKIPRDKIEEHEERHNLYCYLGMPNGFMPYYSKRVKLEDGDTLILCTKGIWENAGSAEFLDSMDDAKEPENVCDDIEELILSKKKKKLPSYTIACIFMDKIYKNPGKKKKVVKRIIMIAIPILILILVLSITLFIMHRNKMKKISTMMEHKDSGVEYIGEQNYIRALKEFDKALDVVKDVNMKKKSSETKEKEEITEYKKLSELIVDGKDSMEKEDYKQAINFYVLALKQVKNVEEMEDEDKEYIEEERNLAISYLEVLQEIQAGDRMESVGDYEGAMEAYEKALNLAREIYYVAGKEEATTRLTDVKTKQFSLVQEELIQEADEIVKKAEKAEENEYTQKAINLYKKAGNLYKKGGNSDKEKEMKEKIEAIEEAEEAKVKEEETKAKEDDVAKAEANILKGDEAFTIGKYDKALEYYQTAIELYTQAEETKAIPAIEVKMNLVQSKNNQTAEQEQQARKYINEAKEYTDLKDYETVVVLYRLAREIYKELGNSSQVKYLKNQITELNKTIEDKSKA